MAKKPQKSRSVRSTAQESVAARKAFGPRRVGWYVAAAVVSVGLCGWIVCAPAPRLQSFLPDLPDLTGKNDVLKSLLLEADREARAVGSAAAVGKLARTYHANLYYAQAAACYRLAEQGEPDNPRWPYLHAAAIQSLGVSEGVASLLRRTLALDHHNIPALLRLAELELKLEQYEEARADFERVLAVAPANAFAYVGRARVAQARGEWQSARQDLERAVALDPRFAVAYRLLAAVYHQLGRQEAAEKASASAASRGQFREFPDPWVDALEDLCHDVPHLLAQVVTQVTNSLHSGRWRIDLLRRIVRCAPENAEAHMYLGQALNDPSTMSEAGAHLEEAVRLDPQLDAARCVWADWLAANHRTAEAEEQINAALRINPASHRAPVLMAALRLDQGRPEEAAQWLRRGLDGNDSLKVPTVKLYVQTLVGLGRKEEAVAYVNQLTGRYPTTGCLWEYLANAAMQEGNWENGIEILRRGLAAAPYNAVIAERLAWVLATSPRATQAGGEEAIRWAQVALETGNPEEGASGSAMSLAAAYARAGRFDEAVAVAQQALAAARSIGDQQTLRELSEQLRHYTARQPFTAQ